MIFNVPVVSVVVEVLGEVVEVVNLGVVVGVEVVTILVEEVGIEEAVVVAIVVLKLVLVEADVAGIAIVIR